MTNERVVTRDRVVTDSVMVRSTETVRETLPVTVVETIVRTATQTVPITLPVPAPVTVTVTVKKEMIAGVSELFAPRQTRRGSLEVDTKLGTEDPFDRTGALASYWR